MYTLAGVRAVVPEVCASQRLMQGALEAAAASDCSVQSAHSCCQSRLHQSDPDTPIAPPVCAFCSLAKAVVEPLELFRFQPLLEAAPDSTLPDFAHRVTHGLLFTQDSRGPPVPSVA